MERKTLVLDLDETLIYSSEEKKLSEYDLIFSLDKYTFHTLLRPYLKTFFDYAYNNFDIIIWTSASEDYAQYVCNQLFPNVKVVSKSFSNKIIRTSDFHFDNLHNFPNIKEMERAQRFWKKEQLEPNQVYQVKPLKKLLKHFNLDEKKVICIDNDPYKFANAYGNYWAIKDFTGNTHDTELLKFIDLLEDLKTVDDVRVNKQEYIKKHKLDE